jgi:chemotaxis protein methyltransferase CheR
MDRGRSARLTDGSDTEAIEQRLVLEAIHQRYGYDLRSYQPDSMRRRLRTCLARSGLAHFGELQHRLLESPEFFAALLDGLTVQVSEMFRDPDFYRAFRERVVPRLRTYPEIRIWHAGCASGEEPYASAILLAEEQLIERAQIYATDVSSRAIERAREGVFPASQAELYSENYRLAGGKQRFMDHCSAAYGKFTISESLRESVVFFQHDLVTDYALGEMQVIFCRNVLIYFASEVRERVLSMFGESLCRGGFLCLGANESLPSAFAAQFSDFSAEQRIFQKRAAA